MKLTINSVQQVAGQLFGYDLYPNRYNSGAVVSYDNDAIKLQIKGVLEDGRKVSFFTGNVVVRTCSGMLNYKTISKTDWFQLIEGKQVGYKNEQHYQGALCTNPPVYIHTPSEIKPTVNVGDTIEISFKEKKQMGSVTILSHVRMKKGK